MASTTAPAIFFFFSSRRRHTRYIGDWSSDVCSSDLFTNDLAVGFRDGCAQADGQVIRKVIAANRNSAAMEIGRASCRERVWWSLVGGSAKSNSIGLGTQQECRTAMVAQYSAR